MKPNYDYAAMLARKCKDGHDWQSDPRKRWLWKCVACGWVKARNKEKING